MKKRLIMGFILTLMILLNTLSADTAKHWAEPFLQKLVDEGIMTGYPGGNLKPEKELTREEASAVLAKFMGYDGTKMSAKFSDMNGRWSEGAVAFLTEKKVVSGYPDGNFYPNKAVSKEEMAAMTYRILEKKINFSKVEGKAFSDMENRWSKSMVEKLAGLGIISGFEGKFSPSNVIKRGETAAMIGKILTAEKNDAFKPIALDENIPSQDTPLGKLNKKKEERTNSNSGSSSSRSSNPSSPESGGNTPPAVKYSVEVEGGSASLKSAANGETVTVTATIPKDKEFVKWEVIAGDVTLKHTPVSSFVMGTKNVKIKAIFKDKKQEEENKELPALKKTLKEEIANAELLKKDILIAEMAKEVEKGKKFVKAAVKEAFDKVIEKATSVYKDTNASILDVKNGILELQEAEKTFLASVLIGTKEKEQVLPTHKISVEGGRSDKSEAKKGETVTITADTDKGSFKKWISIPEGEVAFANASDAQTSFVMPEKDVRIKAEFEVAEQPSGKLAVVSFGSKGIANTLAKAGLNSYHTNVSIDKTFAEIEALKNIISLKDADKGKQLKGWKINNQAKVWTAEDLLNTKIAKFAIPAENEDNEYKVDLDPVVGDAPAPEPQPETKHSISVEGGRSDKSEAKKGETVTITADADKGSFKKWISIPEGEVAFANASDAQTSFVMPEKDVRIKAEFEQTPNPNPEQTKKYNLYIYYSEYDGKNYNDELILKEKPVTNQQTFQVVEAELNALTQRDIHYFQINDVKYTKEALLNTKFDESMRYINKQTWQKTNDIILYGIKKVSSDEEEEEPMEADKSALDKKIEFAKQYEGKANAYTAESYAEFERALTHAKKMSADPKASQRSVNAALLDLNESIRGLKPKGADEVGEASVVFSIKSKEFSFLISSQCAVQTSELGDFQGFDAHPSAMDQIQNHQKVKLSKQGSLGFVIDRFADYELSDFEVKINGKKVDLSGKKFSKTTGASPLIVLRPKDQMKEGDFELLSENKVELYVEKKNKPEGPGNDIPSDLEKDLAQGMVNTDRALEIMKKADPNIVVFDVRTDGEFLESRIKVDGLIQKDMLQEDAFKTYIKNLDKNKIYLLYCRTEKRSAAAAEMMKQEGFGKVLYMDGGITKWLKEENKKDYTVFPKTQLALDLTVTGEKEVYSKGIVELYIKLTNTHEGKNGIRKGAVTLNVKNSENHVIKTQELIMGDDGTAKASIDMSSAEKGNYLVEALATKEGYKPASTLFVLKIDDAEQLSDLSFESEKQKGKFKHLSTETPEYEALQKNFGKNMLYYKVKKANGQSISLYDFIEDKSKPTVVLFGYPACGGCREMMKFMSEVERDQYNYIELITSVDEDMSKTVLQTEQVLKDLGIENMKSHVVYDADDKIWQSRLDLKTTPNFMILDKDGRMLNMAEQVYAPVYADILKNSLGITVKIGKENSTPKPNGDPKHNAAFKAIYKMNIGEFELTDLDGSTKKIKDIVDGKRATLIGLGSMNCGSCQNAWKSFNNYDLNELPFNIIEALNKPYDSDGVESDKYRLRNSIFKNVKDVESRLQHFYYGGDEIYNLPRTTGSNVAFELIPIGLFLDRNCNIVEFEFYPDYSKRLIEKGKKVTNTVY